MIKQEIDKILNQEMSRKQFLVSIGLGLLTIIGIPAILHILSPKPISQGASHTASGTGFGGGAYGV